MKNLIAFFIFMALASCENQTLKIDNNCAVDSIFIHAFLSDVKNVIEYSQNPEKDAYKAYKSFINIEILIDKSTNLDKLKPLFFDSRIVEKKLDQYLDQWIVWLNKNRCHTYIEAEKKFKSVEDKYFSFDYESEEFIEKLKISYPHFTRDLDLPKSSLDSIVILRHKNDINMIIPGWNN